MGDLPIGFFDHRVMVVDGVPVIFGGLTNGGVQTKRTYTAKSGTAAPKRIGDLNSWHGATNNQQGMGYIHNNKKLFAIGDPQGGGSTVADILTLSTGIWSPGFSNVGTHGLSGVSPIYAKGYNLPFMAWGDSFSIDERLVMFNTGQTVTAFAGFSPSNAPRPFEQLMFTDDKYLWRIDGAQNIGGNIVAVVMDSALPNNAFQGFKTATLFSDAAWWGNLACGETYVPSLHFIFGGLTGAGGAASNKAWMLDTSNVAVPVSTVIAPMPRVRCRATCHVLDNGLIAVIGGGDLRNIATSTPNNKVDLYYPYEDRWIQGPDLPQGAIWRHSSVKLPSGKIMIVGGSTGNNNATGAIWYLSRDGFSFTKADD